MCRITWRTCAGLQDETLWWVVSKFLSLIFLTGNSFTHVENKMPNEKYWWQTPLQYCKVVSLQLIKINQKKYWSPYILCWIPSQKRVGHHWLVFSGSTHSQSPPSAGMISSGFLSDSQQGEHQDHPHLGYGECLPDAVPVGKSGGSDCTIIPVSLHLESGL